MMIDLTGRAALVTGGARGIGRAIVIRLATQGADVAFSYRGNAAAAADTVKAVEALGRRALAIQADVRDPATAETVVKATLDAFGKVDILVNNAGITRDDLIMRMTEEAWRDGPRDEPVRRVLHDQGGHPADAQGPVGPDRQHHLRLRPGRPDRARPTTPSAKAGLIGLTKATARELASRSITVNAVAPGFVLTELTQDLPEALKAEITPADAARAVRHDRGGRRRGRLPGQRRGRATSPGRSSPSTAAW